MLSLVHYLRLLRRCTPAMHC